MADEREKTRAEDMKILRVHIYSLVGKGYLAPEHAAEALEITVEQLQEAMTEYKNHETIGGQNDIENHQLETR